VRCGRVASAVYDVADGGENGARSPFSTSTISEDPELICPPDERGGALYPTVQPSPPLHLPGRRRPTPALRWPGRDTQLVDEAPETSVGCSSLLLRRSFDVVVPYGTAPRKKSQPLSRRALQEDSLPPLKATTTLRVRGGSRPLPQG
jgi:hypothetical protein